MVSFTVCRKSKGRAKSGSFNGICFSCGKFGHLGKFCYAKGGKSKRERRETAKVGQSGRDGQKAKVGTRQLKVGTHQAIAGMNYLERDSKQFVLMMEMFSDWCVPVKHVAKLSRMRGSTSTKTNIKFFVDPEEEDRDNDTTSDCLGSKDVALEDDARYTCSCCEAGATGWQRTRYLSHQEVKCTLNRCRQFLRQGEYGFVRSSTTLGAIAKASGCRFWSLRNRVMTVDWLTSHLLTESDGSRANDFYTTADGSKVYNEGQKFRCLHTRRPTAKIHAFSSCQSDKGSGISTSNGEGREQACF